MSVSARGGVRGAGWLAGVCAAAFVAFAVVFAVAASGASAQALKPWWHLLSGARPSYLVAGGEGVLVGSAVNVGDAATSGEVEVVDRIPAGLEVVGNATLGNSAYGAHTVVGAWQFGIFTNTTAIPGTEEDGECHLEGVVGSQVAVCVFHSGVEKIGDPFVMLEVRVGVRVRNGAHTGELNRVSVSGGGAAPASISRPVTITGAGGKTPFGVEDYEISPEEVGGGLDTQAGSHPFQTTFTFGLNETSETNNSRNGEPEVHPVELARDAYFKLPPGLVGNPQGLPRCSEAQFIAAINECPAGSIVGVATTSFTEPSVAGITSLTAPVFNLETSAGEAARLGFLPLNQQTPVYISASVRTGSDYGVTGEVHNIPQTVAFFRSVVSLWGVPGEPEHNETRGACLAAMSGKADEYSPCEPVSEGNPPPFFELPTSCSGVPLTGGLEMDSWEHPGDFASKENVVEASTDPLLPQMDGCGRLPFDPSIEVHPDVADASTATGLSVDVHVPQEESLNAKGLGEADVRDTTVTLPAGIAVDPSGGDGLEACSQALVGFQERFEEPPLEPGVSVPIFTPRLPGSVLAAVNGEAGELEPGINFCSNASKIGTVRIKTPLLKHDLEGAVYLAAQESNPFGSLVAMYVVAEDPESGVLLKLPGEVSLDQQTGQLTATFLNTPQAPFEDAEFHFFGGERAPLATPAQCGGYETHASLTPWSAEPADEAASTVARTAKFNIETGPNGGACPGPQLPFEPTLTAGMTSIQAGGFSPFTTTMSRPDGNQHLHAIELKMPEGLTGILKGVELCPEPQADEGLCAANSLIGETTVSVGVGGDPFTVTGGRVYLTGPFNGTGGCTVGSPGCAPFGLSIVNPAKAGPYDLAHTKNNHPPCDCVLVRAKIEVDPITAALTVSTPTSGPYAIPTILEGIPLQIKHVNATVNRPGFTLNPTSCDKLAIGGSLFSAEGAAENLTVPFQAANCQNLQFTPKITVTTAGQASKANGAGLTFKIGYPPGALGTQTWFNEAKFDLPKQLPARLETLQRACLANIFETNRAACPPASIIGHATVHTEVLPVPLTGPVYFVSYGGQKFPEAVIVLEGYGITIDLHGETFIDNKTGITSATFHNTPDVPFENIEVTIPTGRYSEFGVNLPNTDHYNFCGQKLTIPTLFKAANGQETHQNTPITITGCSTKLTLIAHHLKNHTLTLTIYTPAAGKLKATGKGLTTTTKTTTGQQTITLTLHTTKPGKYKTKLKLTYTPTKGKTQHKTITLQA